MTHQFLLNLATVLFLAFSIIITTTDGFIPAAPACISRSSELGTTKTTKKNISRRRILRLAEVGGTNEFYDDLKRRIKAETNPYSNIFAAADHEVSTVHIISFALGTSRQGIHSIEFPKGSGNNVVLAFESREACAKFAEHLRAQHFFDPTPEEVFLDTLESFAETLGVYVQVVPEGVELLPPSNHVEKLGKHNNRNLREKQNHLNYVFDMEDGGFEEDGLVEEEESFQ